MELQLHPESDGAGPEVEREILEDRLVEGPLEGRIGTISANSRNHLLSAVESAVTGENFSQRDLCH